MIATEPQREVLVPIKRVKRATADKKIVVAATRDELKARRSWRSPFQTPGLISFDTQASGPVGSRPHWHRIWLGR